MMSEQQGREEALTGAPRLATDASGSTFCQQASHTLHRPCVSLKRDSPVSYRGAGHGVWGWEPLWISGSCPPPPLSLIMSVQPTGRQRMHVIVGRPVNCETEMQEPTPHTACAAVCCEGACACCVVSWGSSLAVLSSEMSNSSGVPRLAQFWCPGLCAGMQQQCPSQLRG